jgi:capsular polysaccharide biosynthesis protein
MVSDGGKMAIALLIAGAVGAALYKFVFKAATSQS